MVTIGSGRKLSFHKYYYIIYEFAESQSILKNQFISLINNTIPLSTGTKTFGQKENVCKCLTLYHSLGGFHGGGWLYIHHWISDW